MEGLIIAVVLFGWFGGIIWSAFLGTERHPAWFVLTGSLLLGGMGFLFQQYETQLYYNAATKTMMPAKVCAIRGEWTP